MCGSQAVPPIKSESLGMGPKHQHFFKDPQVIPVCGQDCESVFSLYCRKTLPFPSTVSWNQLSRAAILSPLLLKDLYGLAQDILLLLLFLNPQLKKLLTPPHSPRQQR